MATFTYKARKLDGSSVTGSLPAENERAALLSLDRQGLFPVELKVEAGVKTGSHKRRTDGNGNGGEAKVEVKVGRCAYCHDRVNPTERVACSACLAVHHRACWAGDGACAACGENKALVAEGEDAPQGLGALLVGGLRGGLAGENQGPGLLEMFSRRRIHSETAARFARELADLSQAGVPILKALDAVSREPAEGGDVIWGAKDKKDDQRARALLADVRRDVAQGAALAAALERRPELFGVTSVSIVRAGEAGGFLDTALRRVAVFAERELALSRKVRGALAYPLVLSTLSFGAVVFLLTWVVPRFAVIYADLGGALPWATQLLMDVGDLITGWWWLALLVGGGLGTVAAQILSTPEGQHARDRLLLRLPLVRQVVARASIARFARTLGTLLGSGVNILAALEIAKDAAGNREFARRLARTIAPLREGSDLARPLRGTQLFPPQVVEMVEVGQETGTLVEVLERVSDRADEEVDHALRIFVTVFEPALIVTVAAVVFFVVVAALLPVFSLNSLIQ
jgi:type II secretory pathway component PulF